MEPVDAGGGAGGDEPGRGSLPDAEPEEVYMLDQKVTTTTPNYGAGRQDPDHSESGSSRGPHHHHDDEHDNEPMRIIRIGDDETRRMYASNMVWRCGWNHSC